MFLCFNVLAFFFKLHHQFDIMTEDRFNFGYNYRISLPLASLISVSFIVGLVTLAYLVEPFPHFQPMVSILMRIYIRVHIYNIYFI